MERLLDMQAKELSAVRTLAHDVSRTTRRVVMSWHNAGLAAAGGWAFEDLATVLPSPGLWDELRRSAKTRAEKLGASDPGQEDGADRLLRLRWERLAVPAVRHAVQEVCTLKGLDPAWDHACGRMQTMVTDSMPEIGLSEDLRGEGQAWRGPANPGQRRSLEEVLSWCEEERDSWIAGLRLMVALWLEAEKLLRRGDLESFVLPWIDKFFISSKRLVDRSYLPALVQWIREQGGPPLILFWEDTIHPRRPSFKLALDAMRAEGLPFRGVGVFDGEGSARWAALDTILQTHRHVHLYALRPWDDTHHPGSFHRMLEARDFEFFTTYDSSWKDNLSFLYVGTQVFPLLSEPGFGEYLPAWVGAWGAKHPFGRFFRWSVRCRSLREAACDSGDAFSARYARWANLG